MAIMMISEQIGAGPEMFDMLRDHGAYDKMRSAPGFLGHWNGTTDTGVCVIEMWESPEAHQAWFENTIKPLLPPGADMGHSYVHLLGQLQPS